MERFYEEHSISTKVGDGRRYLRYEIGDPERMLRTHWHMVSPQFVARIANQASGIVIPRYPPSFLNLADVPAELRPDQAVVTDSHWHYHGDDKWSEELVIPSTGKRLHRRWVHTPEEMAQHIEKVHGGINDQTVHLDENRAKYVFPPGDGARRLDQHPQAFIWFASARRVFFAIEGCIKADAILSAGEAVFSVPSVTLWRAPELGHYARRLRERIVFIVPDADYRKNRGVMTQALLCRSYLRRYGLRAEIAAPPKAAYDRDRTLKGIDDYLVSGGTMDDLDVLKREAPYGLAEWLTEHGKWRNDKAVRAAETLRGIAEHADENGQLWAPLKSIGNATGIGVRRAQRGLHDLVEVGAIEVDGSLEVGPRWRDKGYDWIQRPTIIVHPDLRARDKVHRLGDSM
jgi:hypothetical protein